jgi:phenylacetate-CoA ligase
VKALICYGESTFGWQKDLLKETFKCSVHDQYGMREQVVFAGTCEKGNLHIFPEYGITELIDKNGEPVTKEGEMGEIVGTGFHTSIFPFIRYKTGDLGVYTSQRCGCGRSSPLFLRIEGRLQDLVVSRTKRLVPIVGTYGLVGLSSQNVKECQLYQDTEGEIILNIVRGENYTDRDAQRIKDGFEKRFGDEFSLSIRYVESIPRTTRGKFRFLIQKLPVKFGP